MVQAGWMGLPLHTSTGHLADPALTFPSLALVCLDVDTVLIKFQKMFVFSSLTVCFRCGFFFPSQVDLFVDITELSGEGINGFIATCYCVKGMRHNNNSMSR